MASDAEASSTKPGSEPSTTTQEAAIALAPTELESIECLPKTADAQPNTEDAQPCTETTDVETTDVVMGEDTQDQVASSSLSLPQISRVETEVEADDGLDWTEDTELDAAVLMPQPEQLEGRSTKTGYVYDVRMR